MWKKNQIPVSFGLYRIGLPIYREYLIKKGNYSENNQFLLEVEDKVEADAEMEVDFWS